MGLSKSIYRLLVTFSWISILHVSKIKLRSRVMASFAYFEAFSEQCEAKLVYRVLLLYLIALH